MRPSYSMATKFSTCRSQRVTSRRELGSQAKNRFDDPAQLVESERGRPASGVRGRPDAGR